MANRPLSALFRLGEVDRPFAIQGVEVHEFEGQNFHAGRLLRFLGSLGQQVGFLEGLENFRVGGDQLWPLRVRDLA